MLSFAEGSGRANAGAAAGAAPPLAKHPLTPLWPEQAPALFVLCTAPLNLLAHLLRLKQMLPKGTDLSVHDQVALGSIADLLNNRSRQTLNWRSPIQAFRDLIQAASEKAQATIH